MSGDMTEPVDQNSTDSPSDSPPHQTMRTRHSSPSSPSAIATSNSLAEPRQSLRTTKNGSDATSRPKDDMPPFPS